MLYKIRRTNSMEFKARDFKMPSLNHTRSLKHSLNVWSKRLFLPVLYPFNFFHSWGRVDERCDLQQPESSQSVSSVVGRDVGSRRKQRQWKNHACTAGWRRRRSRRRVCISGWSKLGVRGCLHVPDSAYESACTICNQWFLGLDYPSDKLQLHGTHFRKNQIKM